jgi:hypothetical protein
MTDQNLWFVQAGSDLQIDILGSNTNCWSFPGGAGEVQEIDAGGLKIDGGVSQFVRAMATFSQPRCFDPAGSSNQTLSNDAGMQNAIATASHA